VGCGVGVFVGFAVVGEAVVGNSVGALVGGLAQKRIKEDIALAPPCRFDTEMSDSSMGGMVILPDTTAGSTVASSGGRVIDMPTSVPPSFSVAFVVLVSLVTTYSEDTFPNDSTSKTQP